ncbi:metallophosphoesterase [Candidatus Woesearchaeota archaeon]|jgi:uncharacterized protein|nr:metallophosphoesterase [Candidatus Woesearchaeota archaeon]MBT3538041.1 metallophosphoesterase [Candidatus Woesearchaeota archaeon]MBT4697125.1 metallophosphoesterase [Candidatus Woesearchaeota archaeon]MBT4717116.1 metallophosphoesterase [Candidatus Woesearchaeota archaeon]MBT7105710.1 metallophosphoesterase [Candidatus Woesearchaeota archaeon]
MEVVSNIKVLDLCLYLEDEKILVVSDVHMGYEEALNKGGVLIPRHQFRETMERLKKTLTFVKPETIILNGDVKHEFGTISETEWRHTIKLIDYLAKHCKKLVLLRGNHDKSLGPIAKKRNIEMMDEFLVGDTLISHGDHVPDVATLKDVKTIIIGHEHPAVSISDYPRVEKFKCFLVGKWKRKNLVVMPSYNLVTEGTDVVSDRLLSPFLDGNLDKFRVVIVSDSVYDFGTLKDVKKLC